MGGILCPLKPPLRTTLTIDDENWKEISETIVKKKSHTFIQYLMDAGLDINALNGHGTTMLSYAAECGNMEIIEFLVNKGADGNVTNTDGTKPLHMAALHGHIVIVKFFINLGVFVDSCDNKKWTPLHYAVIEDVFDKFRTVDSYMELVQFLVDSKANLNALDWRGSTPLLLAYHTPVVDLLIKLGADVGCCDKNQWTLLHRASRGGWFHIVKCIVERGSDINISTTGGHTPLHQAAIYGNQNIVEYLLTSDANIECRDNAGFTVLHYTCRKGWLDAVTLLLKKGCDVNTQEYWWGNTPLHDTVWDRNLEMMRRLLKAGADCNVKNFSRKTAFNNLIVKIPCLEDILLFIENGAYIQSDDYDVISKEPLLKEGILQDIKLCTLSIMNKFNNGDLSKLYKVPVVAEKLPPIEKMKLLNDKKVAHDIAQSVKFEIQSNGFCNVLNVCPIVLNILCVASLVEHYNS